MTEQELRELIRSQLGDIMVEGKGPKLDIEVPMRAPELKRFTHNYLRLNKKYSILRMPEYSMTFGENKWSKETHWKYDTNNEILYVHDEKVVDVLVNGGAPSDLFESNLNEGKLTEAEEYITNKFKVGDTIKLLKYNWKVTEINFKPGKSYRDSFTFVNGKQVSIKAPPTNKNAVGYKIEDGNESAFYYCYKARSGKTIMKLAIKGFNESVTEGELTEAMDINDPFMIQVRVMRHAARERKAYMQYLKDNPKPKVRKISFDKYLDLLDTQSGYMDDLKDLTKQLQQADSDMNNEAGQKGDKWTDDDANRYGGILMDLEGEYEKVKKKLNKVQVQIEKYNLQ
jgi:hypothetical protein